MSIAITRQSYGKSRVCLSHIRRHDDRHDFIQIAVDVLLEGDFDDAYVAGDNHQVIPTDTMKNTVYAVARQHGVESIEAFAGHLAKHFTDSFGHVSVATVGVVESLWQRMAGPDGPHRHAFTGGCSEQHTCEVTAASGRVTMTSGLKGLQVLKTTESGFEGFVRDQYTTLGETSDRIFATTIAATWDCPELNRDWSAIRLQIREILLEVFSARYSPSVQKTLHEMADAVLERCSDVSEISLSMPNQHHLLVDLEKLGLENQNDIFVPTAEPFGVISATIARQS